jgi:hypothetical protein
MAVLPRGTTGSEHGDAQSAVEVGLEEMSTNAVTAGPANVQATAAPLLASYNLINAGPSGGSVILPPPGTPGPFGNNRLGLTIATFNVSGNPINVFGAGNDTINGLAAGVAANQMNNSIVWFTCVAEVAATGVATWLAQGLGTGYAASGNGSFPTYSSQDNVAPTPTGTQTTATAIVTSTVGVTPAATTDAVRLPPAIAGMEVTVVNKSATNTLTVFPASAAQGGVTGGDNINGGAQNASINAVAAIPTLFFCLTIGQWWVR